MSSSGQPMPQGTQPVSPAPNGAVPVQGQGATAPPDAQAFLLAVSQALVQFVKQISQQTGAPPPLVMKAIQTVITQALSGGQQQPPPGPAPGAAGLRPTQ